MWWRKKNVGSWWRTLMMVPIVFSGPNDPTVDKTWSYDVFRSPPMPEPNGTRRNPAVLSGTRVGSALVSWGPRRAQVCAATHVCSPGKLCKIPAPVLCCVITTGAVRAHALISVVCTSARFYIQREGCSDLKKSKF